MTSAPITAPFAPAQPAPEAPAAAAGLTAAPPTAGVPPAVNDVQAPGAVPVCPPCDCDQGP
jgi:hypothetical protein